MFGIILFKDDFCSVNAQCLVNQTTTVAGICIIAYPYG